MRAIHPPAGASFAVITPQPATNTQERDGGAIRAISLRPVRTAVLIGRSIAKREGISAELGAFQHALGDIPVERRPLRPCAP